MAMCFGPPPLPPNKKPGLMASSVGGLAGRRQRRQHLQLQQQLAKQMHQQQQDSNNNTSAPTYKSFRDERDDPHCQRPTAMPVPPPMPPAALPLRVPALSLQMPKLVQQLAPPPPPPAALKPQHWSPAAPPRATAEVAAWTASPTTPLGRRRCRQHARTLSLTTEALLTPPSPPPPLLLPPKPGTPPTHRHGRSLAMASSGSSGTLCRSASPRAGQVGRIGLRRSRSEGNLAMFAPAPDTAPDPSEPRGLQRCLKALSGSWKNLLQRKLVRRLTPWLAMAGPWLAGALTPHHHHRGTASPCRPKRPKRCDATPPYPLHLTSDIVCRACPPPMIAVGGITQHAPHVWAVRGTATASPPHSPLSDRLPIQPCPFVSPSPAKTCCSAARAAPCGNPACVYASRWALAGPWRGRGIPARAGRGASVTAPDCTNGSDRTCRPDSETFAICH